MKFTISLLVVAFVLVSSCTKGAKTPDGLITMFAKDVATKKLDMDYYEKYTTGEMLNLIKETGLDEFDKKTRLVNVNDVKVKILNKTCEGSKCVITYRVKYHTKSHSEGSFESEVKKIAELEQFEKYWKLAKITNLKTYHESSKPINPLDEDVPSDITE